MFDPWSFLAGVLIGMIGFGLGGKVAFVMVQAEYEKRRRNPYAR